MKIKNNNYILNKIIYGGLLITLPFGLLGQNVGINTDGSSPDASAQLDIKAGNRGVLIPRLALTGTLDNTTVVNCCATGLLVYNTATAGTPPTNVTPGFYYWNGSQWTRLQNGVANVTADNGLTMTGSHIQLGGTLLQNTDIAQAGFDFRFTGSGSVGIGVTGSPSHKLHVAGGVRAESGFIANDGTASVPAFRFSSTNSMGMYRAAANELAFSTNGNERLRISASGNVGVGTSTPSERLHVSGNLRLDNAFMPNNSAGLNGSLLLSLGPFSPPTWLAPGTANQILTIGGAGIPVWSNANFWNLTGNSGTNPSINFVGTTDNQPIVFRANNIEVFRMNVPGTSPGSWSIQRGVGNTRGEHAVDLQSARANLDEVASGYASVIGGGIYNKSSHYYTTVAGGRSNVASSEYATVGGGGVNVANGYASTISGGGSNQAPGDYSFIGGGLQNQASGGNSVVCGGYKNSATGVNSAIVGGRSLTLGNYSFGFSGQNIPTTTNLSSFSNIAAFVDVNLWLYNRDNTARELRFYEPTSNASGNAEYTAFRAQSQTSNITYTWPSTLSPVTTPSAGILQTDGSGNLSWLDPSVLGGGGSGWLLNGNGGTNPTTNFIGTTDANPLIFRTNNSERFRVTSGGNVGINTTSPSERLVVNGNIGLQSGTAAFVGTLDNQPLQLRVQNQNSLILNPPGFSAPAWSIQRDLGGNPRGLRAVDWQIDRTSATQVASGNHAVISGGRSNTASGADAVVAGGLNNTSSGDNSFVGGGQDNSSTAFYSAVGGGYQNQATGESSVVAGGFQNQASNTLATVAGGSSNLATGNTSSIGGGANNSASGTYSVIAGGNLNNATGNSSALLGGSTNTVAGQFASIGGGYSNDATSYGSALFGGINNSINSGGLYGFIGGGSDNQVISQYGAVSGGQGNLVGSDYGFIGGGNANFVNYEGSVVAGGANNSVNGYYSCIGGGNFNQIGGSGGTDYYHVISGGFNNVITEGWTTGTISGGSNNQIDNNYATVGGGDNNSVFASGGTITGGTNNAIYSSAPYGSILGGQNNGVSGSYSTILGGSGNEANASFNLVFGQSVSPTVTESHRVYFFGSGSGSPSGFFVLNRTDGDHPIHVGTNSSNGNGAYLSAGGVWTNVSTRSKKDRFTALVPDQVLQKISQLKVEGWFYKESDEYHIGPYAEDFFSAFHTGVQNAPDASHSLAASDVAGVALLGIQALNERSQKADQKQEYLEKLVLQLEQELKQLKQENSQLRSWIYNASGNVSAHE